MVRNGMYVLILCLVVLGPHMGWAAEAEEEGEDGASVSEELKGLYGLLKDRVSFSMGYTVWVAKWQTPFFNGIQGQTIEDNSEFAALNGPTVTVAYRIRQSEWFHTAFTNFTRLRAGFDFQEQGGQLDLNNQILLTKRDSTAIRRDHTITVGVAVWRGFGVFSGYYNNKQRFTDRFLSPPGQMLSDEDSFFRSTKTLKGPIFGAFGNVPATDRVSIYGNLGFAILDFGPTSTGAKRSSQGFSSELGTTIKGPDVWFGNRNEESKPWGFGTSFKIGFRAQIISMSTGATQFPRTEFFPSADPDSAFSVIGRKGNDITWGPIFSVTARF